MTTLHYVVVSNNTEVWDNDELITVEIVHGGSEGLLAPVLVPLGKNVGPVVLGDLRAADTDLVACGLNLAEMIRVSMKPGVVLKNLS